MHPHFMFNLWETLSIFKTECKRQWRNEIENVKKSTEVAKAGKIEMQDRRNRLRILSAKVKEIYTETG